METTVKNLSDTKVQVTITLGAAELAEAEQIALTKLSKTTKVPGFREGKVPAGVAAKHVNPQSLQEQTLDDAISKAVAESFTKEGIRAIDRPAVDVKKYVPGEQLEFVAEVEVLPKITLGDYKKLTTKPEKVTVPAKEITDVLERMRQGYAEKKEVERAAKDGDEVLIDFVGKKTTSLSTAVLHLTTHFRWELGSLSLVLKKELSATPLVRLLILILHSRKNITRLNSLVKRSCLPSL